MSKLSWLQYWSKKTDGGHRFQNEDFLKKEAKEKLFHLDGGSTLLDFGCGSADLLIHFAPQYQSLMGVDFSPSMLEKAREKIQRFGFTNVTLIQGDDISMWDKIDRSYDRIMNSQVIQYLSVDQIDNFLNNALRRLNNDGKIIFFDVIDPRLFDLYNAGLFSKKSNSYSVILNFIILKSLNLVKGDKKIIGYAYDPRIIERLAQKNNLQMEYVKSMYYEYRYHAIFSNFPKI